MKLKFKHIFLFLFLFACVDNSYSDSNSNLDAEKVSTLLKRTTEVMELLKKARFRNVAFDFSMVQKSAEAGNNEPQVNYWSSGKMWFGGESNSLLKISYRPRTTVWLNGPSPYLEQEETIAFNGKYWLLLTNKSGPIHSMFPIRTATITDTCPAGYKFPRWDSAENFLVTHAAFINNLTLEKTLQSCIIAPIIPPPPADAPAGAGAAAAAEFVGYYAKILNIEKEGDLWKVSYTDQEHNAEIWIDSNKSGAIKRYVITTQNKSSPGWYEMEDVIESYTELKGLWLPTKATRRFKNRSRELVLEYSASNFELIDDSSNLFEIKLEPGTRVSDERNNTKFIIGRDLDETVKAMESTIK